MVLLQYDVPYWALSVLAAAFLLGLCSCADSFIFVESLVKSPRFCVLIRPALALKARSLMEASLRPAPGAWKWRGNADGYCYYYSCKLFCVWYVCVYVYILYVYVMLDSVSALDRVRLVISLVTFALSSIIG